MIKYNGIKLIIWNRILFNENNPILYGIKSGLLKINNWTVK